MFYYKSFIVSKLTFRALINFEFNVNPQEMDKEDMVHIYAVEYYSTIKRNEIESVVVISMNLELTIQSEVSQKNKYHILMHTYRI